MLKKIKYGAPFHLNETSDGSFQVRNRLLDRLEVARQPQFRQVEHDGVEVGQVRQPVGDEERGPVARDEDGRRCRVTFRAGLK